MTIWVLAPHYKHAQCCEMGPLFPYFTLQINFFFLPLIPNRGQVLNQPTHSLSVLHCLLQLPLLNYYTVLSANFGDFLKVRGDEIWRDTLRFSKHRIILLPEQPPFILVSWGIFLSFSLDLFVVDVFCNGIGQPGSHQPSLAFSYDMHGRLHYY